MLYLFRTQSAIEDSDYIYLSKENIKNFFLECI